MEDMEEMEETRKALSQCQEPYKWAMSSEWDSLKKLYTKQPYEVVGQLTTNNDTVLHVVAVAGRNDVLEFLIDLIKKDPDSEMLLQQAFSTENNYGNNILHEVAVSGNPKAANVLMSEDNKFKEKYNSYEGMLAIKNSLGETPLYRAAAFGHTNLVKYLATQVKQQQQQEEAMEYHFKRKHDNMSILQIAVISQHFETALWLLVKYPDLANKKESNGLTCLQLLAQMPYAFEAKFRKSKWKMLIYKWIYPSTDDLMSRINQPSQSSCSQNITRINQPSQFSCSQNITSLFDDDNCDSERRSNQSPNQNDDLESGSNQPPNQNHDLDRRSNQPRQSSSSKKITSN